MNVQENMQYESQQMANMMRINTYFNLRNHILIASLYLKVKIARLIVLFWDSQSPIIEYQPKSVPYQ